jgi:hypothetical protein
VASRNGWERLRSPLATQHLDADAGLAGVGRYGIEFKGEPAEVVMAPRSGAGLRAAMGGTLRCANHATIQAAALTVR